MKEVVAKAEDPLQGLRRSVARQQGVRKPASISNRSLLEHLTSNVDWSRLLPLIVPLVMQVLRGRQAAQTPKDSTVPSNVASPTLDLGGIVGALPGTQTGSAVQPTFPQADPLAGILGTLLGTAASSAVLQPTSQPDMLSGLLQILGGGQAQQSGGLLGLLGASPEPQSRSGVSSLLDSLAGNIDLDGDGVPDAIESILGNSIDSDTQRRGAVTLLEQLLNGASPEDLASFSRGAQGLLRSIQKT